MIWTDPDPANVLVQNGTNGTPPLEAEDFVKVAFRIGRVFSASTDNIQIPTGNRLKMEIWNPPDSGRKIILYREKFTNDRQGNDTMLVRRGTVTFSQTLTAPDANINILNRMVVGTQTPTSVVRFEATTDAPIGGQSAVGENLPLNGMPLEAGVVFSLLPGRGFIYEVEGQTGGLTDVAVASIYLEWLEEDV